MHGNNMSTHVVRRVNISFFVQALATNVALSLKHEDIIEIFHQKQGGDIVI